MIRYTIINKPAPWLNKRTARFFFPFFPLDSLKTKLRRQQILSLATGINKLRQVYTNVICVNSILRIEAFGICTNVIFFFFPEVKMFNHVRLFATPWAVACQAPLSMEFSKQGYWSGLPFPSPGDLPIPDIEPGSPALQEDSFPSEP